MKQYHCEHCGKLMTAKEMKWWAGYRDGSIKVFHPTCKDKYFEQQRNKEL